MSRVLFLIYEYSNLAMSIIKSSHLFIPVGLISVKLISVTTRYL